MHESVLLEESCEALHIQKGGKYIDATLGAGGHTAEILALGGEVLGIEADDLFEAAGYQTARDLENAYFALCSKILPELVGFLAQFPTETQRRLLSHLTGIEHLLETNQGQEVSAHHKVD